MGAVSIPKLLNLFSFYGRTPEDTNLEAGCEYNRMGKQAKNKYEEAFRYKPNSSQQKEREVRQAGYYMKNTAE